MGIRSTAAGLMAVAMLTGPALSGQTTTARPAGAWQQYTSPEAAGWDTSVLAEARDFAEEWGAASVLLVHRGRVVVAWGEVSRPFKTYSVRKSLVNLLYGAAAADGRLSLDRSLADLGIDDIETLTPRERQATVRDLLAARSGVYHPAAREPAGMQANRPARGSHAPDTHWFYNNWDFNTLAAIYAVVTGSDIFDAFTAEFAGPLGFEDYEADHPFWIREPSRTTHPAYEIPLSARDMARVGQLVLQAGRWEGRQVVPAAWLDESTRPYSALEGRGAYGYLWWVNAWRDFWRGPELTRLEQVTHTAAVGNGGQTIMVLPDQELVLVTALERAQHRDAYDSWGFYLADLFLSGMPEAPVDDAETGPLRADPLPNPPPTRPVRVAQPIDGPLENYTGRFQVALNVVATITAADGGLFVFVPGRGEAEMFQFGPDRFFLQVAEADLEIERGPDGEVIAATLIEAGRRMRAARIK
jgi:CubicO group peptidase (beta-lactamase class C family)